MRYAVSPSLRSRLAGWMFASGIVKFPAPMTPLGSRPRAALARAPLVFRSAGSALIVLLQVVEHA